MEANTTMDAGILKDIHFGVFDMSLFVLMVVISTIIGIYFGFWGKKEDTPKEYLHGGKNMKTFPVAVSLVASFISGIMVMGTPTEIYLYGIHFWLICLSVPLVVALTYYVYLPVFFDLQVTSTYEYLELRFDKPVRIMASFLWTVGLLLYIPIVVYVPALAFSQVTGMNVHFITPAMSVICIFYTMLGGIKAVVWTDVLQGVLMVVASVAVIILGVINIGGFEVIWQRSLEGGRLDVDFDPSPFARLTFWIAIFGNFFHWTPAVSANQAMVQKFLSLPSLQKAKSSLILFAVMLIAVTSISCFTGLVLYATYHDCDPVKSKIVGKSDQILPYFVMDVASSIPGLPGLFVAGIFSAALSTMSSSLNGLGATLFEDFVRPCLKNKINDRIANNCIKAVIVIIGAFCVLIVFIVAKLGSIMQLTVSFAGVTQGAIVGIFSLGMFIPRANSKGALAGSITSIAIMSWIVFGTQNAIADGRIKDPMLESRTDGCKGNLTLPSEVGHEEFKEDIFILYRLSFLYYSMAGTLIVIFVGTIVSYLTAPPEQDKVKSVLVAPVVRRWLKKKPDYNCTDPA